MEDELGKGETSEKPFDGAISRFAKEGAPKEVRRLLKDADKEDMLDPRYPYRTRMSDAEYDREFRRCQLQLVRAHAWMRAEGVRMVAVFEGRDAAGKGGAIQAVTDNLNPRHARVVALAAPSEAERGQWYFQRYVEALPTRGQMILFDRSWYNRAVVEHVFGFCTPGERELFFQQAPGFEEMLVQEGIILLKIWLEIGQAEQIRQFLQRERDPLKQWKLSRIDVDGLSRWDAYQEAIGEMFARTHSAASPWTVIWGDDKRRARINAMRAVLARLDYPDKSIAPVDPKIVGGPEILG